ncbi:MAG: hypothetical protein LBV75_08985 [Paludibacter sp.]|jgi:tetratricopeptide (TPR) repeat protein|nr:hypothetical protein [Paludibacter sp.]
MKNIFCIIAALTFSNLGFAQDFQKDFNRYFQAQDTIQQREVLAKWEKAKPQDAELFTCYFNYFFSKSRQEIVTLTTEQPQGESLVLSDSLNQTAGYVGSQIVFDKDIAKKGIAKIEEGINLYPNRLDMRFGKIYVLGQIEDWGAFTDEIINAIRHSKTNKNQWTWTNNEKQSDGKDFFLSSLQDYQLQLYNTGNDSLLSNMAKIAEEILKIYPEHIESLSNLSICYLIRGEYEKALVPLLKAEKINPQDNVVLNNIAYAYRMKEDKTKAIEYYEKVIKYSDGETKEFAKQQIETLKQ